MDKKKTIKIRRILVIAFLAIVSIVFYINFRGNYLQYKELGENYLQTFLIKQKYLTIVTLANFVIIYFYMYFTGRGIKKGLKVFFEQEKKEMPKLPNKSIALVVSVIESIIIGLVFTPNIILCISNTSFGEVDPIFNLDISFFMFIRPLIKMSAIYLIGIFIAKILYIFGYYVVVFNKYFDGIDKETLIKSRAMKTLTRNIKIIAIVLAGYILVCSMDIVFDNFLTTDNNIKLAGAGFIDSTIKYWGYNLLAIIILISIYRALRSLKKGKQSKILKDLLVIPAYLVVLFVVMLGVDIIFVRSNEFDKEKIYIEKNIQNTKKAYGIDCDIDTLSYSGTITVEQAENNENVINNTVIVDKKTLLDYLKENQSGTGYYTFDTAKPSSIYEIDGKKRLVYVSPREIVNNRRTYNSKTYEYTHGYGLIISDATRVTEDGEIIYVQNDITGNDEKIKISNPQIYYGLETNTTVVTNAKNKKEFDYAYGEKTFETEYKGNSGLALNFIDRLILGIKQKNINLAFASSVTDKSKLLINRNILKRAKLALPDVVYDSSPYPVVDKNGDIYWVIDAYTISSSYPYSTYTEIEFDGQKKGINYIRNSIKVIINAYTGEIKYYITDRTDPIAMAYRKVYPELFQDLETQIDQSIQDEFIYPEFLYNVQSTMLQEYHNTKADVLYRSDDTWQKATYKNGQTSSKKGNTLNSYYTMVKENDEDKIGLVQIYTPKDKQSITAYLVGTIQNGQNKLTIKTLEADTSILGPTQLDTQISQDETIQNQINALTVTGAKVTRNMTIVPIDNTLIYIETLYQTLVNESNLPTLKKVIVASGNKVAIGENLQEAVKNLISQSASHIELENTEDIDGLIDAIIKANTNLTDSLNGNNWELIGSDIQKLQNLIKSLEKRTDDEKKNNTTQNEITNTITEDENKNEARNFIFK